LNLRANAKTLGALFMSRYRNARYPLHASWIVTNRCNLRCSYCDRPDAGRGELGHTDALGLIDLLAKAGCVRLSLTGGEPLAREDLPILLARARFRGIATNINTNGILIPKRMEVVRLADAIVVSLDGPREINDALRGRGSFEGALEGARKAQEAGVPVSFYTVLGKSNLPALADLVGLAEEMRSRIFFQPGSLLQLGSEGCANADAPDPVEYRKAIDKLIGLKKTGRPIGNSVPGLRYIRSWPDPNPMVCRGGRLFLRIDADGHVRACGRVPRGEDNFILAQGVRKSMEKIGTPDCSACYSAARVEFNLLAQGSAGAALNFIFGKNR
jgi:MoaA/NifB/PqqE/SkfB family radical SAM enzyme